MDKDVTNHCARTSYSLNCSFAIKITTLTRWLASTTKESAYEAIADSPVLYSWRFAATAT